MGQLKSKPITSEEVAARMIATGQKKAGSPALESDRLEKQKSSRRMDSHRGSPRPYSTPRDGHAGIMFKGDTPPRKKELGKNGAQ